MVRNRRPGSFWAFLLAAALSFGGIGCIATGFSLEGTNLGVLLLVCVSISLGWAIASHYRFGVPAVAIVLTVFWILPNARTIINSQKYVIHVISTAYGRGYGWPVLFWEDGIPAVGADHALALIACMVSLVVVWVVFRQKKAIWASVAAFLPLAFCLVLTDTVPDSEYLMLLLGGLLLLALTNPLRRIDAKQASRATACLLVPVMLVTAGLFWAAPREGYIPNESAFTQLEDWLRESELWQWLTGGGASWWSGDSGADEVSLDTLGGKSDSDEVAFYVTATKSGYLYLRGRGYDNYDGLHWTASDNSSGRDDGWAALSYGGSRVTVRMNNPRNFYYFSGDCGPRPPTVAFEAGMVPNKSREKTYTFTWVTPIRGGNISEQMRTQCLQLPENTATWAQGILQEEVYKGLSLRPAKEAVVSRIGNLVRASATYSLDPGKMPLGEQDFAKWFFTEAESGYCVHFATTATVLLRAAGIPARYVTGYALGVMFDSEMAVTQSRAHAWVEYYDEEVGWKILDPTPGYNDPFLPTDPTTEPTTEPTEPTVSTSRPTTPTTEPTTPTEPSVPDVTIPSPPTPGGQKNSGDWKTAIAVLLWIMLGCVAVWAQYRLRMAIRRWYIHRGGANQQALARYRAVRIRSRIFRQAPPERLLTLAEKAKYSQHTLTDEELAEFDVHMAALAATLQKKPWLLRWLLRLTLAIE